MIIYKCLISNDEMFSDAYKITESKDGMFYEVEGKYVTRRNNIDDSLIGANPSAEAAPEDTDESVVSGIDVALNHKLVETKLNKMTFKQYMKANMKAIKTHLQNTNPERVDKFMADALATVKMILENFKNYKFFTGESMNEEGMVVLLDYRADDTPFLLFLKEGLLVEKC